jgi:hypothetical protein
MTAKHVDPPRPAEVPWVTSPDRIPAGDAIGEARVSPEGSEAPPEVVPAGTITEGPPRLIRPIAIGSVVLALLGGGFYWWTPLGIVLSITGLLMGFVAWLNTPPRSGMRRLAVAGTLLSVAALALDVAIALQGLELVQFGPLR